MNYADDTNLIVANKCSSQLVINNQYLTTKVAIWFNDNELTLNSETTSLILFRTKRSNFNKIVKLLISNCNVDDEIVAEFVT